MHSLRNLLRPQRAANTAITEVAWRQTACMDLDMTDLLIDMQELWLVQDTFMLPNLQKKPNDRMLVTRLQPGPFSG